MTRFLTTIVLCFTLLFNANAQDNKKGAEMHVDMPDETEETDLIEKGQVQLETAAQLINYSSSTNSVIGQAMLRAGLHKKVELRLLIEDGKNRDEYIEETVQSTYPLALGAKIALLKDHRWLPDMALVSYLKLPFTSRSNEQKIYWSPIFLLAFQNKVGEKLKIEYNGGVQQEAYSPKWLWLANASVHYQVTDPFEIFVEYYAQYQQEKLPIHNLGIGCAYQINNTFEIYMATGTTVDLEEYNRFITGGVAIRLPKATP